MGVTERNVIAVGVIANLSPVDVVTWIQVSAGATLSHGLAAERAAKRVNHGTHRVGIDFVVEHALSHLWVLGAIKCRKAHNLPQAAVAVAIDLVQGRIQYNAVCVFVNFVLVIVVQWSAGPGLVGHARNWWRLKLRKLVQWEANAVTIRKIGWANRHRDYDVVLDVWAYLVELRSEWKPGREIQTVEHGLAFVWGNDLPGRRSHDQVWFLAGWGLELRGRENATAWALEVRHHRTPM